MNKRIFYLDFIKVIAMIMVVFNHSHQIIGNNNLIIFSIHYLLFYFSKCAVPLFLMISGALIIKKNDSYKKIITRIIKIVIPLIIVTIIWLNFNKGFIFDNALFPYWLWYLLALIAIYLFLPFINKMVKNMKDKDYKIFLLLFLILPSVFYTVNIFYCIYIQKQVTLSNELINNLITIPVAYFILGHYLNNIKVSKRLKNYSIIVLLFTLFLETFIALFLQKLDLMFFFLDNYKSLFVLLMSPTLFIIIKYYFENYKETKEFSSLIFNLATNSFGIYLFHVFVIELLAKTSFFQELIKFNSLEAALVIVFATIFLLDIMFTILKHIPILKTVLKKYFS